MKRTQISRRPSKKKRAFDAEYAEALPEVLARGCEFETYLVEASAWLYSEDNPMVCNGRLVGHHARGRRARDANDPENLRCLCRKHHEYVHAHPRWAMEVGLMVSRIS